jgi:hypothetical protein
LFLFFILKNFFFINFKKKKKLQNTQHNYSHYLLLINKTRAKPPMDTPVMWLSEAFLVNGILVTSFK